MAVPKFKNQDSRSADVDFWTSIVSELLLASHNFFEDNIDTIRFPERIPFSRVMKNRLLQLAASKRWSRRPTDDPSKAAEVLGVDGLGQAYGLLEDSQSRDLFVKLLLYRMLGPRRIKLPINSPTYWKKVGEAKRCLREKSVIQGVPIVGSLDLYGFDNLELICHLMNIVNTFVLEQYRCDRADVYCRLGDVAIDGGGCWGDTALYFARHAERVYCYECIPSNLAILKENLDRNPQLAQKISLVSKALHRVPGLTLSFADSGPGSHSADEGFQVETDSIDNMVDTNPKLSPV